MKKYNKSEWIIKIITAHLDKIVYGALLSIISWLGYEWKQAKTKLDDITSLPAKYQKMIEIRKQDSTLIVNHFKQDSIKDACSNYEFLRMKHYVDSLGSVTKRRLDKDSIFEIDDFQRIDKIENKLNIK